MKVHPFEVRIDEHLYVSEGGLERPRPCSLVSSSPLFRAGMTSRSVHNWKPSSQAAGWAIFRAAAARRRLGAPLDQTGVGGVWSRT